MKTFVFVTLALIILAAGAQGQNIEPPLITVTGQAEVRVPPDEVVFTLNVESIDKDMMAAKTKTDESVRQVLAIARKNNIKPEDVQTSNISVEPKYNTDDLEYEQRRTVKRVFIGYEVSKTIGIRLRDISRFDQVLSDVLKAGVTRVGDVDFRDSELRKHKDQARAMAMKAAQEKARMMAKEIGQSIGPAYAITEQVINFGNARATQNSTSTITGSLSSEELESSIAPGSISVTAQVVVRFRLND
jgi:uncharacterized protein YggE